MPSLEDKTFKLTWTVDDYSVWGSKWENWKPWITSDPFPVIALGGTQWQLQMCPRTDDGYIHCIFQRDDEVEEYGDISFEFSATILGKDRLVLYQSEKVIYDIGTEHEIQVNILRTEELPLEYIDNDQLVICYDIRQIAHSNNDCFSSGMWKDELKVLSDDMRKLLESGYLTDVALKSSDGHLIPAHFCVLHARWKKLIDGLEIRRRRPKMVVCSHMTGTILTAFVFYLYTGTVPCSDVTIELFEFIIERFPIARIQFYTLPLQMSMRSIPRKENVAFSWYYEGGGVHFHRALSLRETAIGEILVDISAEGSHLGVRFSLSTITRCVHLTCTATLVGCHDRLEKSAFHFFVAAFEPWNFPDFIPMSLLNGGLQGIYVEFELLVSIGPNETFVESTLTEFQTGSRDVHNLEMVASGLEHFFMDQPILDLCDVELRTEDGCFRSCKSVLGIRSDVLQKLFRDHPKRSNVRLEIKSLDSNTLSSVLEYIYTGWTDLASPRQSLKIYTLAIRMQLHGLARKCQQYLSASVKRHTL